MDGIEAINSHKLAVLIDADNARADLIELLLAEITKYGVAHVKRIYGDWTDTKLSGWKSKLHKLAIQPIQQFRYTAGKNATDSALIIDAMDLLYSERFDGFCIVSSDSDFTRLASRIREAGLAVYGFGERKTPEAFVSACDKFIYIEILTDGEPPSDHPKTNGSTSTASEKSDESSSKINKKLLKLLRDAYDAIANEDGWAHLGSLGSQLTKLSPSFDSRNYGHKKLGSLVQSTGRFEIRETPHDKSKTVKDIHIKWKG